MTSNVKPTSLLLRREVFGGILFDPINATQVEIDKEAFELVYTYFIKGVQPKTNEERKLFDELNKIIDLKSKSSVKVFDLSDSRLGSYDAPNFSAPVIVDFQINTQSFQDCPHCYAVSKEQGGYLSLEKIEKVLFQLAGVGVYQIALGGGEPLFHPDISKILRKCCNLGIVPNLTTSGAHLDKKMISDLKTYCGAVALSLEGGDEKYDERRKMGFTCLKESLRTLLGSGIKTVLQITLSAENIANLEEIIDFCQEYKDLYGVIFLGYKAVGRGRQFNTPLSSLDPSQVSPLLKEAFTRLSGYTKVGYDCCLTSGILKIDEAFGFSELDLLGGCSAMRGSVGITADLDVVPCTFLPEQKLGNLENERFKDIWLSSEAFKFRSKLESQYKDNKVCASCSDKQACLGGCPSMELINCHRDYLQVNRSKITDNSVSIDSSSTLSDRSMEQL